MTPPVRHAVAWDTATGRLSLALARFGAGSAGIPAPPGPPEILFAAGGGDGGTHSSVLPPLAARALSEAGLRPSDLDLVCAGRGPGSFTGLRTGLSFAKGLAMGAGCPAVGIPTLETLAAADGLPPGLLAPVLDARHGEVFTALYLRGGEGAHPAAGPLPLTGILVLAPGSFYPALADALRGLREGLGAPPDGACLILGPGAALVPEPPEGFRKGPADGPDAAVLASLGLARLLSGAAAADPPLPLYGRTPEIFKTWRPPRRLPAREALEGPRGA